MEKNPGKSISKKDFDHMAKKYKDKNPSATQSVHFGPDSIKRVMNAPGAAGLRIFFGEDEEGKLTTMLVPTDAAGVSLFNTIEDRGQLCPPYCAEGGSK